MRHYLLDTNVLIDYLINREPFGRDAVELMEAGVSGEARFYVASLSFANIEYVTRRLTTAAHARLLLDRLMPMVEILSLNAAIIRQTLDSNFTDFEDGIQYFTALTEPAIAAIITRDPKGFRRSALPVLSVADALIELDNASGPER
ncbi:type II toxin-antitoxin system VapC family toxin [Hymenobacter ruricola]|uniref:PIN domain-containing protein n=1 Tax=Hymenobacter ruricola TaxID=2791023 RepID=A0ABS0I9F9_9BACT|nr:PIN domain-containing protein [Hymenobacter ruricola]MBF9223583.1 PIN domain-containing protein [Hymenobacter ruricola]